MTLVGGGRRLQRFGWRSLLLTVKVNAALAVFRELILYICYYCSRQLQWHHLDSQVVIDVGIKSHLTVVSLIVRFGYLLFAFCLDLLTYQGQSYLLES